ncbi:hypothetical protein K8640_19045 [Myxococcus sp. XM-1-1-1]|uniref:hypothetical protein n=1 Tax=Myxococcus sp. XM-1-1-1 TaxID=2874602 RepID=UPI001CC0D520|nr:hypothetical protein [Myxococcus sp. XM-1-1-1]MBZ4410308.1 hypothetical protein [Myxococcus sp. XM-1-1-1]
MSQRPWLLIAILSSAVFGVAYVGFADIGTVCACHDGTFSDGLRLPLDDKDAFCASRCKGPGGGRWLRDGGMSLAEIEATRASLGYAP